MMSSKGLILFDLDGTLVNSAPDLAVAINKTLKDLGLPEHDEVTIEGWVGNGARVLLQRALSGSRSVSETLDESLLERALPMFFDHYAEGVCVKTHLYDGVKATLETLSEQGYRLALVTNKPERFIDAILKALAIDTYFELSIGGDTLSRRKPDPLQLIHACEVLGVSVDDTLMVGDSKNDILAAKAAGMKSLGLTYGYNYGESIALSEPEWVVDSFSDILDLMPLDVS